MKSLEMPLKKVSKTLFDELFLKTLYNLQVDTILEFSSNQQTKYYALQILESVIKTRWKVSFFTFLELVPQLTYLLPAKETVIWNPLGYLWCHRW